MFKNCENSENSDYCEMNFEKDNEEFDWESGLAFGYCEFFEESLNDEINDEGIDEEVFVFNENSEWYRNSDYLRNVFLETIEENINEEIVIDGDCKNFEEDFKNNNMSEEIEGIGKNFIVEEMIFMFDEDLINEDCGSIFEDNFNDEIIGEDRVRGFEYFSNEENFEISDCYMNNDYSRNEVYENIEENIEENIDDEKRSVISIKMGWWGIIKKNCLKLCCWEV